MDGVEDRDVFAEVNLSALLRESNRVTQRLMREIAAKDATIDALIRALEKEEPEGAQPEKSGPTYPI